MFYCRRAVSTGVSYHPSVLQSQHHRVLVRFVVLNSRNLTEQVMARSKPNRIRHCGCAALLPWSASRVGRKQGPTLVAYSTSHSVSCPVCAGLAVAAQPCQTGLRPDWTEAVRPGGLECAWVGGGVELVALSRDARAWSHTHLRLHPRNHFTDGVKRLFA
ncbi:hypothetical protein OE88DRAFT_1251400 [Heliocybe sulcata]|uniref:Uncharacterized protein n=1 Tax=Heliocybe sulcata TaxID=5364 RepID=A0A5C3N6X8_9AGAM|nr:hypothetical protein OE88DRAFT_1251400 [Heliocybe sulcata]